MRLRVLSGMPEAAETVPYGLPGAAGRRERFRRYAREHFVDAGEAGATLRHLVPAPRCGGRPVTASGEVARVRPARRRAAGRSVALVRLARLSRLSAGAVG
ncbi:hypothetical protein ACGFX4_24050 [Kitasatospora sp. NPDC048365]|uniref:hypothetical protein n=1 Tax=Kitasatospora sp. NPDC048365 TaxID=3364050 RepID=UPI0037171507